MKMISEIRVLLFIVDRIIIIWFSMHILLIISTKVLSWEMNRYSKLYHDNEYINILLYILENLVNSEYMKKDKII